MNINFQGQTPIIDYPGQSGVKETAQKTAGVLSVDYGTVGIIDCKDGNALLVYNDLFRKDYDIALAKEIPMTSVSSKSPIPPGNIKAAQKWLA